MKTYIKRAGAACLALLMTLSLTACGLEDLFGGGVSTDDATALIQGNLDEIYLGKFDPDYLELVESTEAEAEAAWQEALAAEAEFFAYYFEIENLTDALKADIIELYKEIYAHTSYTVNPATKIDDTTFGVKVQIRPLDIFKLVTDDWETGMAAFWARYDGVDPSTMTEEEYLEYDAFWAEQILALCREKLPDMGYMDETSMVIQVAKDDNNVWSITDDDFSTLDGYIIYYP